MPKTIKPKNPKPRSSNYEEKVKFEGKFIDMVKMSVKDANKKAKKPE